MAASYSYCDRVQVGIWLTIGMGLMGAFLPSLKVNPLDLSPNYAGSLMAIVGGMGAASGIVTPLLAGELTTQVNATPSKLRSHVCVRVRLLSICREECRSGDWYFGL